MADRDTITAAAFARLVGATQGEMDALIGAGALPQPTGRNRRLPLRQAAAAYLGHLRAHLVTARAGASASRAQDARAEAAALALAVDRRELLDADDVDAAVAFVCAEIRNRFDIIPTRSTRDLAPRRVLTSVFFEALAELAASLAADGNPLGSEPLPASRNPIQLKDKLNG